MESSPRTTCIRCGTGILQITADLNEGRCMPCVYAQERESQSITGPRRTRYPEPLLSHLHPAEDVMVSVDFHPGWNPDLTSWVIQISNDGTLLQAIVWYRQRVREAELFDPVSLTSSDFAEIQQLVGSCSTGSFLPLASLSCVDDAAMISLILPAEGVRADLPLFCLEGDLKRGPSKFDEAQRASFDLFRQLWRFADRHAPYSMRDHQKGHR